jgi:hypothetical protein
MFLKFVKRPVCQNGGELPTADLDTIEKVHTFYKDYLNEMCYITQI